MSKEQGFGAITLAEEDISTAGRILGRPSSSSTRDSKGLPTGKVTAVRKLIYQDNVVRIIGCAEHSRHGRREQLVAKKESSLALAKGSTAVITGQAIAGCAGAGYDTLAAFAQVKHAVEARLHLVCHLHNTDQFGEGGRGESP